jgi:hypothetical protein
MLSIKEVENLVEGIVITDDLSRTSPVYLARYKGNKVIVKHSNCEFERKIMKHPSKAFLVPKVIDTFISLRIPENNFVLLEYLDDYSPLSDGKDFRKSNEHILKIIQGIQSIPELNLSKSSRHRDVFMSDDINLKKPKYESIKTGLTRWSNDGNKKYVNESLEYFGNILFDEMGQWGNVHGELNFAHIYHNKDFSIALIDWDQMSQYYYASYDLAEYLVRYLLDESVGEDGLGEALKIRDKYFQDNLSDSQVVTFNYCILNRWIGITWEYTKREDISSGVEESEEVLREILL